MLSKASAPFTTSLSNQLPRKSAALLVKRSSSRRLSASVRPNSRRPSAAPPISSRMPPPTLGGALSASWRRNAAARSKRRVVGRQPLGIPGRERRHRALPVGEAIGHQQIAALVHRPEVGDGTLDDPEPMAFQLQVGDDHRVEQAHRVGGHRVAEARMKLLGHGRAADHCILFEHDDAQARAGQVGGAGEPVVPGADDGDVVGIVGHVPFVG